MKEEKLKSNKLLRKAFFMMYPSMFILVFMTQIEEFIDSILSGSFLGEESISAIAIGWPGIAAIDALTVILGTGCALLMSISIGRGDKEKSNQLYSIGMIGIPLFTAIIGNFVAGGLNERYYINILFVGGGASTPHGNINNNKIKNLIGG